MEEFRKFCASTAEFCASMAGAPDAMADIDYLTFTNQAGNEYSGSKCLKPMAADVEKLNEDAKKK